MSLHIWEVAKRSYCNISFCLLLKLYFYSSIVPLQQPELKSHRVAYYNFLTGIVISESSKTPGHPP